MPHQSHLIDGNHAFTLNFSSFTTKVPNMAIFAVKIIILLQVTTVPE
jgi:hypothetical protein